MPPALVLPPPLGRLYAVAGRIGTANMHLQFPPRPDDDGRLFFLSEEQGVYFASCDATGGDPAVWGDRDEGTMRRELQPLSLFRLQWALFEAILDPPHGGWGNPDEDALARILEPLRGVRLPGWRWPCETSFHAGFGVLAMAHRCADGDVELHLAGRLPELVEYAVAETWEDFG